jgi:hypothetical protein
MLSKYSTLAKSIFFVAILSVNSLNPTITFINRNDNCASTCHHSSIEPTNWSNRITKESDILVRKTFMAAQAKAV